MTYYDIVGFLPLELLIYVVEHLNLEDVLRSQRVRYSQMPTKCSTFSTLTGA